MSAQNGKVPVVACVSAAYRFLGANWRALLPACLVVGAAAIAAGFLAGGAQPGAGILLAPVISAVAGAAFAAAVLRRALRPGDNGMVRLGMDEARLLGAAVALLLMFLPLVVIVSFVLTAILARQIAGSSEALAVLLENPEALQAALSEALDPTGQAAFSLFILIMCGLAIWIGVRLSLVNAATIGERRIVVLQTWSWTQGNLLRVAAAFALAIIPPMLVAALLVNLVGAIIGSGTSSSPILFAVAAGLQGTTSALSNIPAIALAAELYRGLRPSDFSPK